MARLLEDPRTAGESKYKVPHQVPMLLGAHKCSWENEEGAKASQEITVPHLSDPHCHRSPSLLSNHILRLDASLNWALCRKRFCYTSHDFLVHCHNKVPPQAVFGTGQLLQLRKKNTVHFKNLSKILNFPEFKLLNKWRLHTFRLIKCGQFFSCSNYLFYWKGEGKQISPSVFPSYKYTK